MTTSLFLLRITDGVPELLAVGHRGLKQLQIDDKRYLLVPTDFVAGGVKESTIAEQEALPTAEPPASIPRQRQAIRDKIMHAIVARDPVGLTAAELSNAFADEPDFYVGPILAVLARQGKIRRNGNRWVAA